MTLVRKDFDLDGIRFECWAFVTIDGKVFCKLKELANALGYVEAKRAYHLIDDKWKYTWSQLMEPLPSQSHSNLHPATIFVSEPGIYSLVFRSHKPEAKRFTHYVFEVILPTIRQKGGYISPNVTTPQANNLLETLRQQLLEKDTLLTETRSMLEGKERMLIVTQAELTKVQRMLTEARGELTYVQGELVETRGKLEQNRQELTCVQGELAETRGKLEQNCQELTYVQGKLEQKRQELTYVQGELAETKVNLEQKRQELAQTQTILTETRERLEEKRQELAQTQIILAETQERLSEEMQQRQQLQNDMQIVRPKVAVITDRDVLRQSLRIYKYRNQYICVRRQRLTIDKVVIPIQYELVFSADNVPNAINVVNRLRELLTNAKFRYNKIISNENVVAFIRQCIEDEINRPMEHHIEL